MERTQEEVTDVIPAGSVTKRTVDEAITGSIKSSRKSEGTGAGNNNKKGRQGGAAGSRKRKSAKNDGKTSSKKQRKVSVP